MRQDKKLQLLETLHTVLIENLLDKVKSGEAKAGDLNVARQLLKDNGIECIPSIALILVNIVVFFTFFLFSFKLFL